MLGENFFTGLKHTCDLEKMQYLPKVEIDSASMLIDLRKDWQLHGIKSVNYYGVMYFNFEFSNGTKTDFPLYDDDIEDCFNHKRWLQFRKVEIYTLDGRLRGMAFYDALGDQVCSFGRMSSEKSTVEMAENEVICGMKGTLGKMFSGKVDTTQEEREEIIDL